MASEESLSFISSLSAQHAAFVRGSLPGPQTLHSDELN